MTGRGIDQVLAHPSSPRLHEPYVQSALDYVEMAESANGRILKPVDFPYVWGDAAEELTRVSPNARIVNLETSITTCDDYDPKGINYRMHPANTPCLTEIDCCVLANNHVLDWGRSGLKETLSSLQAAGMKTAGPGLNLAQAIQPAVIEIGDNTRVLVFAACTADSGVPRDWAATDREPGVALLPDLSGRTAGRLLALDMTPLEIKRFRLRKSEDRDAYWSRDMLHREGRQLGTQVILSAENRLALQWR